MRPLIESDETRYEAVQMMPVEYREFEAAISKWEERTGLKVERAFSEGFTYKDKHGNFVTEYKSNEWKNFAMFLGSREANEYRRKCPMKMEDAMKQWQQFGIGELDDMKIEED
jgi:hypothetical protein